MIVVRIRNMSESPKTKIQRRTEFILVEHACLQEKIRHAATDLYRTETIIPLAIGVIYVWLNGRDTSVRPVQDWMWWVPVAITVFGAWRQRLRYKSLWAAHEYVRLIEGEIYDPEPGKDDQRPHGWESHWVKDANRFYSVGQWEVSSHGLMRITFWVALLAGTSFLAGQETLANWFLAG